MKRSAGQLWRKSERMRAMWAVNKRREGIRERKLWQRSKEKEDEMQEVSDRWWWCHSKQELRYYMSVCVFWRNPQPLSLLPPRIILTHGGSHGPNTFTKTVPQTPLPLSHCSRLSESPRRVCVCVSMCTTSQQRETKRDKHQAWS